MLLRFALLAIIVTVPLGVAAQPEIGIDIGGVIPYGNLGTFRDAGVTGALSVGFGTDRRGFGLRAEISGQRLFGADTPTPSGAARSGDYTSYSTRLALVYTLANRPTTGYALVGLGGYAYSEEGARDAVRGDEGVTGGVHLGLGLRSRISGIDVVAEVQNVYIMLLPDLDNFVQGVIGVRLPIR
ncbi:MAG: hypothetical protein AAGK21_08145 [Bacteroidota bacterium]